MVSEERNHALMFDRDRHADLYLFKPVRTAENVSPESLLTRMEHTPSLDTTLMLEASSSKKTMSRYDTPVTAVILSKCVALLPLCISRQQKICSKSRASRIPVPAASTGDRLATAKQIESCSLRQRKISITSGNSRTTFGAPCIVRHCTAPSSPERQYGPAVCSWQ